MTLSAKSTQKKPTQGKPTKKKSLKKLATVSSKRKKLQIPASSVEVQQTLLVSASPFKHQKESSEGPRSEGLFEPMVSESLEREVDFSPSSYPPASFYQKERERKMTYYVVGVVSFFMGLLLIIYLSVQNQFLGEDVAQYQSAVAGASDALALGENRALSDDSQRLPASVFQHAEVSQHLENSEASENPKNLDSSLPTAWKKANHLSPEEKWAYWVSLLKPLKSLGGIMEPVSPEGDPFAPMREEGLSSVLERRWDSLHYSETLIALVRSQSPQEFVDDWKRLHDTKRDRGGVSSHLPFHQSWLPENQQLGILKEITDTLGVDGEASSALSSDGVPYLRIEHFSSALIEKIPVGTLLSLVHEKDPAHSEVIVHQGLVFRDSFSGHSQMMFAHALKKGTLRVLPLLVYISHLKHQQQNEKGQEWPLVGINLNQVL